MTVRDIQGQLEEMYGVEISATLISNVTNSVIEDVKVRQTRPLDTVYPVVWFDALHVKIRHEQRVVNKAVYLALVSIRRVKKIYGASRFRKMKVPNSGFPFLRN